MKGKAKAAGYIAAATGVGIFAYCLGREHSLLVHQTAGASRTRMIACLGLFILSLIVLGWIVAYEVTKFVRARAEGWMLQIGPPTEPVPELQEAERLRASGEPLDAIRVLREYLQANPYELYAMSRIAEIYRYDLKNDLAAALEYEELIKHKLPADQWAWSALHLAKLYGRLNELEKSVALLERIDNGYGHTVAGRRAKKALEQVRDPQAQSSGEEGTEENG